MIEWIKCMLGDIGDVIGGATPSTKIDEFYNGNISWITPRDLSNHKSRYISGGERNITQLGLDSCSSKLLPKNTILFTSRAPIGYIAIANNSICTNQGFKSIVPNADVDPLFVYYLLKYNKENIEALGSGTTFKEISGKTMKNIEVNIPKYKSDQQRISSILSSIDDKIELNNQLNDNLEKQAQAIFKSWFVDFEPFGGIMPADWAIGTISDFYDISIGKTPPRKEPQWFSVNANDVVWISIADMGKSGTYISNSSEYLVAKAIEKYNVQVIPSNTVILSFKLTVGRVAITNGVSTTNEAIAHFKRKDDDTTEYLYCYLKNFNYQTLGSTSSIATAVNSKTIKAMPFVMPSNKAIQDFNKVVQPLFASLRNNLIEIDSLSQLRDTLLPKLMSGEIDVSEVEV